MIGAWKLNPDDVKVIKDLLELGKTHQSIGDMFGVSREHITKIANGQRWNEETNSFIMKDEKEITTDSKEEKEIDWITNLPIEPKRSNDFRQFTQPNIEIGYIPSENEGLNLEQKIYMRKFIESLTGKKIKKMIIEF